MSTRPATRPRRRSRRDTLLRTLKANPCPYLASLGITTIVAHYKRKNPCGGRLIARSGVLSAYSVR